MIPLSALLAGDAIPPQPIQPEPSQSQINKAKASAESKEDSKAAKVLRQMSSALKSGVASAGRVGSQAGAGAISYITRQAPPISFLVMLIAALLLSFVGFMGNLSIGLRALLFALYCLVGYFGIFKDCFDRKEVIRLWPVLMIVWSIAPKIGNMISDLNVASEIKTVILFVLFIVGYGAPLVVLLRASVEDNIITTSARIILILLILFFIASHFLDTGILMNGDGISYAQKGIIEDGLSSTWSFAKKIPTLLFNATMSGATKLNNETDRLFAQATGSYEEQVDEKTQTSQLGVAFKSIQLSNTDGVYYQGDPVSAWASVESKSLDRPINIYATCYADRNLGKNLWTIGNVSNPAFTVYDTDYRDVTCSFAKHVFVDKKSHQLAVFARFNYTTDSYLRRYFISQNDYSSLRSAQIDPKVQYQIPSSDETGKFTNGPVEVSVMKNNLLQPLDAETKFTVGYRVAVNTKAGWNSGKLIGIKNFVISMPPGFTIEKNDDGTYACSTPFMEYPQDQCIADCANAKKGERCIEDCGTYLQYQMQVEELANVTEKDTTYIKTPLIITCPIEVKNVQTVLGKSPISIKNFRAMADYEFEISTEKAFRVETKEGYVNPNLVTDFCDFKTKYYDTNVSTNLDTIRQRVSKIIEDIEYPQENVTILDSEISGKSSFCVGLIKGIIAYQNRAGTSNSAGLGYVGMTKDQIESVDGNTNSTYLKETRDDIQYVSTYLTQKLDDSECTYEDSKLIDCAIEKLICENQASTCAKSQVPIVIQLAKRYSE